MKKQYILNQETIAVYSNFSHGHEYAGVLQGNKYIFVSQSPLTIIENSFLSLGNELEGARKSSRHHLKKRINLPIPLSVKHNIILIQCKAASKQEGVVWIVAKHIMNIEPYKNDQTLIHTTGGHELIVDMNPEKLQMIRNLATILYSTLVQTQKMLHGLKNDHEENIGYILIKENGQINYTIKKKKKK